MIVRYENSLEDMVALNRYHCDHSPAVKRTKLTFLVSVSALLIVGSLFIPTTKEASGPFIIAGAIAFVAIFAVLFNFTFSALLDRNVRRLYKEGTNKGILGQHELEIDDSGLVERTEVNETRQAWQGVERIVETHDHIFIYISSVMAHVIPKHSVTAGDADAFIARAKQLWLAVNPDAEAGQGASKR